MSDGVQPDGRPKVTRASLRAERAANPDAAGISKWSLWVSGALLAWSLGMVVIAVNSSSSFEHEHEQNARTIADLTAIVDALDSPTVELTEEVRSQLAAAQTAAEEVAAHQQEFTNILINGDHSPRGDGVPSQAVLDAVMHRQVLAPYFMEDTFVVGDALAYSYGSQMVTEMTERDPRFSWFQSTGSAWELTSVMPTESEGEFEVIWMNKNTSNGDLYAWTRSTFSSDHGKFGEILVVTTTLGDRALDADRQGVG